MYPLSSYLHTLSFPPPSVQVCKRLGRQETAMKHFLLALDLDPKDRNLVKAAIDRLDLAEGEGEEEEKF